MEVSETCLRGGEPDGARPSAPKAGEKRAKLPTPSPVGPVAPRVAPHPRAPASCSRPWSPGPFLACSGASSRPEVGICGSRDWQLPRLRPPAGEKPAWLGVRGCSGVSGDGGGSPVLGGDPRLPADSEPYSADLWEPGGCRVQGPVGDAAGAGRGSGLRPGGQRLVLCPLHTAWGAGRRSQQWGASYPRPPACLHPPFAGRRCF